MNDVAVEYIELGLRLGKHMDGLVDSYYGPDEIKERIDAEELRDPSSLADDAARMRASLDGVEADRGKWLEAQLVGLETAALRFGGAELSFEDEVERYYGVPAYRTPEAEFQAAHDAIDAVLPGEGSLEERYRVWREDDAIPADRLAEVVDRLFDPWVTTKAVGHGSGLGLAIVRDVVRAHGGSISASNQTVGALFVIDLPAASAERSAS